MLDDINARWCHHLLPVLDDFFGRRAWASVNTSVLQVPRDLFRSLATPVHQRFFYASSALDADSSDAKSPSNQSSDLGFVALDAVSVFDCVDRFFGGIGTGQLPVGRLFSRAEARIADRLIDQMLQALLRTWREVPQVGASFCVETVDGTVNGVKGASDPALKAALAVTEVALNVSDAQLAARAFSVYVALPKSMIELIVGRPAADDMFSIMPPADFSSGKAC